MKTINVPSAYKHELRDTRTKEYKIAEIRDYVKAHKGEVIKMSDFEFAGSSLTVNKYINELISAGRLTRQRVRNQGKGHHFAYTWHEPSERVDTDRNGPIVVKSLGFKDWPLGGSHSNMLMSTVMGEYIESNLDDLHAEQIKGMLLFRRHINQLYSDVEKQRKQILEGKE